METRLCLFLCLFGTVCGVRTLQAQHRPESPEAHVCGHAYHRWQAQKTANEGVPVEDTSFVQQYLNLYLLSDPTSNQLSGHASYRIYWKENASDTIWFSLSDSLTVTGISFDADDLPAGTYFGDSVWQAHNRVYIRLPEYGLYDSLPDTRREFNPGQEVTITLSYSGPATESGFGSFRLDSLEGQPIQWTLSQPYGALNWFPVKPSLVDKLDSLTVTIQTPLPYRGISHGNLVEDDTLTSGGTPRRVSVWHHASPIPTYLIAFATGPYTERVDSLEVGTYSGNRTTIPVLNYSIGDDTVATQDVWQSIKPAFAHFEPRIGDYPYKDQKYGHVRIGGRASIEHPTISFLSTLNRRVWLHELAHMWFGDYITCASWQDLWLNEGFASYFTVWYYDESADPADNALYQEALEYTIDVASRDLDESVYRYDTTDVRQLFNASGVYFKGAWALHNLRRWLGAERFTALIRGFYADPQNAWRSITTQQFFEYLQANTPEDLAPFFEHFIYRPGYPAYTVEWTPVSYRPQPSGKTPPPEQFELVIRQRSTTSDARPYPQRLAFELFRFNAADSSYFAYDTVFVAVADTLTYYSPVLDTQLSGEALLPDSIGFNPDYAAMALLDTLIRRPATGLPSPSPAASLRAYPNPSSEELTLRWNFEHPRLLIRDITGRKVLEEPLSPAQRELRVNVAGWPPGVYFAMVSVTWRRFMVADR